MGWLLVLMPVLCFLLLGACWVVSTPAGVGIDEPSHYTRMVGMSQGELIGADVPADFQLGSLTGTQLARVVKEAGVFRIPGDKPVPPGCNGLEVTAPYNCGLPVPTEHSTREVSLHGRYLPLSYVFPAVLSLAGHTTWRTLVLGRIGFLVQDAALLLLIVLALRRLVPRFSSTALGMLALCATPLLLFQSGTLAPNGTEVLAVVAFATSLMAALRMRSRRWLWIAALVGSAASWTRDLGAFEVAVFGVAALALDPAGARWLWARRRTRDVLAAVVLALAGFGASVWQLVFKAPLPVRLESPSRLWADLGSSVELLRDSIGLVGWVNLPIDPVVQALWAVGWLVGLAVLYLRAPRRAQVVAAVLGGLYFVLDAAMISGFRHAGFGAQSRFTIAFPIVVVVLLVAAQPPGASAATLRQGWRRHRPLAAAALVLALGQFSALLVSAHHNANGINGDKIDFAHAAWVPPGGWYPTLLAFAIASASVLAFALLATVFGDRQATARLTPTSLTSPTTPAGPTTPATLPGVPP